MKVTITDTEIYCEHDADELPLTGNLRHLNTCRTASHEIVAWAVKRLGTELEKSVAFYRTSEPTDRIVMD